MLITAGENDNRVHPCAKTRRPLHRHQERSVLPHPTLGGPAGHAGANQWIFEFVMRQTELCLLCSAPTSEAKVLPDESLIGQSTGFCAGARWRSKWSIDTMSWTSQSRLPRHRAQPARRQPLWPKAVFRVHRDHSRGGGAGVRCSWSRSGSAGKATRNLLAVDATPAGHQGPWEPIRYTRWVGHFAHQSADHQEVIGPAIKPEIE